MWRDQLHAQPGGLDVHRQDAIKLLVVILQEGPDRAQDAGVVEQAVDAAVGVNSGLDVAQHSVARRDVGWHADGRATGGFDRPGTGHD